MVTITVWSRIGLSYWIHLGIMIELGFTCALNTAICLFDDDAAYTADDKNMEDRSVVHSLFS